MTTTTTIRPKSFYRTQQLLVTAMVQNHETTQRLVFRQQWAGRPFPYSKLGHELPTTLQKWQWPCCSTGGEERRSRIEQHTRKWAPMTKSSVDAWTDITIVPTDDSMSRLEVGSPCRRGAAVTAGGLGSHHRTGVLGGETRDAVPSW
jgi:hypothetical protein